MHGKSTALALSNPASGMDGADMESYGVVKSRTEGFILAVCRIHDQLLDEMDHTEAAEQGVTTSTEHTERAVAIGNEAHESKPAGESVMLLVFVRVMLPDSSIASSPA
ncbi:hypothetical protein Trisim1_012442 [Trichoderma cf. simile WF8]